MLNRLNVLFLASWYPSRLNPMEGIFVREHAKAVQLYDNVVVIHPIKSNTIDRGLYKVQIEEDQALTEGIETYRIIERASPIPKTNFLINLISIFKAFNNLVAKGFQPDIIHAHVFGVGVPAVLLGRFHHIPVVITEHSSAFPRKLLTPIDIWRAKFSLSRADIVLPVSLALQNGIENYGVQANYRVVPNVVDVDTFSTNPDDKIDHELKKILFAGNLISIKGINYLLQALAELNNSRQDWHLDILGDGPEAPQYKKLCNQLGLSHQVTFHGIKTKKEVSEFMGQSNLFVLPSLYETQGCVLIEAMASGLPIVSTNTGGIPETVDREAGILVPPGDAPALREAIEKILYGNMSFDRQVIVGKACRYRPEVIGRTLDSIYRELC